jgi:hypothetical protein
VGICLENRTSIQRPRGTPRPACGSTTSFNRDHRLATLAGPPTMVGRARRPQHGAPAGGGGSHVPPERSAAGLVLRVRRLACRTGGRLAARRGVRSGGRTRHELWPLDRATRLAGRTGRRPGPGPQVPTRQRSAPWPEPRWDPGPAGGWLPPRLAALRDVHGSRVPQATDTPLLTAHLQALEFGDSKQARPVKLFVHRSLSGIAHAPCRRPLGSAARSAWRCLPR